MFNVNFNRYKFTLIALMSLFIMGCGSIDPDKARVTIHTSPEGAMLYEGDVAWGIAPQTRIYQGAKGATTVKMRTITAIWPSGARKNFSSRIELGGEWETTISRPSDAPGLNIDLSHAAKIRAAEAQRQAADSAAAAAYIFGSSSRPTQTTCMTTGGLTNCSTK